MLLNKFTGYIRRCVDDYEMLKEGDRVAVGISGGKDSMAMLAALINLQRFHPSNFELIALTVDMGFSGMDFSPVADYCRQRNVPYTILKTDIKEIVFDIRQEKQPCSLCSKMRRGALNDSMKDFGCNKLALGHHTDDVVETFFMSLLLEGRINCFKPVTYMSRADVTQIRPMLYVSEEQIISLVSELNLPVVRSTCSEDGASKRAEIKEQIENAKLIYPDLKSKIMGAIKSLPLEGWGKAE
ncbi:MAG: tRNA 2-thiocytidine biosynthesis protein TtcA [Ruminococcaceae bacterium]|nr:tRNA 2-thiocytidine biosynthesis protein TtcA [Oscillospiraceae bacterium]